MCLTPITIPNPNYNNPLKDTYYGILHNCNTSELSVPCGHCSTCIALRQSYLIQRMQMESLDNLLFFGMVSYNSSSLPTLNVNGYKLRYAARDDMSNMMRHIRMNHELPPFRYFAVSERGSKRHRPHWHFIISIPKSFIADKFGRVHLVDALSLEQKLWNLFLKYWRRNYGSRKFPDWRPLLTYKCVGNKRNYDLSFIDTLSGSVDDAAFYATKYSTKHDEYTDKLKSALFFNLPEKDYVDTWKIIRNRTLWSKNFGDPQNPQVKKYILDCIDKSLKSDSILPLFFNPNTGQSFPLSPYYQKKFLTVEQQLIFKHRQLMTDKPIQDIYETQLAELKLKRKQSLIDYRNDDPYVFLEDDNLSDELTYFNTLSDGTFQIPFGVDDFTPDEW